MIHVYYVEDDPDISVRLFGIEGELAGNALKAKRVMFGFVALAYHIGGKKVLQCSLVDALRDDI